MKLKEIAGTYSILRYAPDEKIPDWVYQSGFLSISRTDEELSIVCDADAVQDAEGTGGAQDREDDWKCLKVQGPLDFSLTGILSSIASPLADAKISIFAISTFDTDYVMLKSDHLGTAKQTLRTAGFDVV